MRILHLMFGALLLPSALVLAEPPSTGNLLSGPKVEEDAAKPTGERMTKSGQREGIRREQIQPVQWFGMVRELDLSPEQQTKIRTIVNEFGAEQQKFNASRSDEEREAFRKMREARAAGQEPPRELREMMQKIESQRPKVEPFQRRIWAELTDEQKSKFKVRVDEMRERMMQQRQGKRGEAAPQRRPEIPDGDSMTNSDGSKPAGGSSANSPDRKRNGGNQPVAGKSPQRSPQKGAAGSLRPIKNEGRTPNRQGQKRGAATGQKRPG